MYNKKSYLIIIHLYHSYININKRFKIALFIQQKIKEVLTYMLYNLTEVYIVVHA